jgi:asparagine synthase (glutamine-hydrolysing)
MCGISGEWHAGGADPRRVARMGAALAHRGPDGAATRALGEAALGSRRLAIIDLERGDQPLANEDGSAWIVCNGEIYNYRELRRGLLARGHVFRSESDTEVVLHLYEEEGERAIESLRGMFALAIWDIRRRRLLLARDRFGQKPLFYRQDGSRFLFASEIKGLLAGCDDRPGLDLEGLDAYLALRFVPSPRTMFEGIRKLPPAHLLVLDATGVDPRAATPQPAVAVRRYWRLRYVPKRRLRESEAVAETAERIEEAVESHLVADVPVGAFLSGGMDSSLVAAMAARRLADLPTFAIGVEDAGFDELPWARQVARHCGTAHHEETVHPDMVRLLPRMVHHLDEPSDPVAACMYHAAALAARHVKVVLTGDGGDEGFAGYDRYFGFRWVSAYAALPEALRRALLGPALAGLRDSGAYKNLTQQARWVHELSFFTGGRRFAQATAFFRFGQAGRGGLYTPQTAARLAPVDPFAAVADAFDEADAEADLDRMLYADSVTRLPEHSLALTDRTTMAHGLEARCPLLDHRLAEFVATLPAGLKMRGRRLKHLLRAAARPYLPPEILRRPKQGFMFPLAYWMKGPLAPMLERVLGSSVLVEEGIFSPAAMQRLLLEHRAGSADHHARLWMILNVEVWYRMAILRQPLERLAELFRLEPAA